MIKNKSMNFVFKSESHLGDCLLHAHFMRKVVEKNPNITFDFHLIDKHWNQTKEYIEDIPQIKCLNYDDCPDNHLRGWVGQFGIPPLPCPLDGLRLYSYKRLSNIMGIECPFKNEYDLLYDNAIIKKKSKELPKFDVLLINSIPLSNQIDYKEDDYKDFCKKILDKGKTVVTSNKISNVPCTTDYNLSVMGIGSLSINCDIITGIVTGSIQCCLNVWNREKKFYCIDRSHTFNMSNIKMIPRIDVLKP